MLSVHDLVNTVDLTADDIEQILDTARTFEQINERTIKKLPTLRGRTVVNLFLEPSTRTKSSFELACKRLGADTLSVAGSSSSVVKGESLVDTIHTLDAMGVDMFICRAKYAGSRRSSAAPPPPPVINAATASTRTPRRACSTCTPSASAWGTSTACTWASWATACTPVWWARSCRRCAPWGRA